MVESVKVEIFNQFTGENHDEVEVILTIKDSMFTFNESQVVAFIGLLQAHLSAVHEMDTAIEGVNVAKAG